MIDLTFARARVVFTDRHLGGGGGVSPAPYDTLNLGDHVGDDPAAVAANRLALARDLASVEPTVPGDPAAWVWLRQVHGDRVVTADVAPAEAPEADAAVTGTVGLPLAVMTADCAPIALVAADERGCAVGVVHAGWQGLLRGVVAAGVDAMRAVLDAPIRAVLGPCIHPARYEFGDDALAPLVERFGPEVRGMTRQAMPALDLPAAVRIALGEAGVHDVTDVDVCTSASRDHFSHRRDGVTGRQAVVVVRTA